jgi:polyphosphate glucokinase
MQGYGVIRGEGVEMVLTLGTGMGSALFTNGHLVPNFELGHHPFEKGKTYEERVSERELERIGKKIWRKRMARVIGQLEAIWNYDALYVGGGNARYLPFELPDNVRVFENVQGMTGGVRLWFDDPVGGPVGGDPDHTSWRPPDDASWRDELVAETASGESDPE